MTFAKRIASWLTGNRVRGRRFTSPTLFEVRLTRVDDDGAALSIVTFSGGEPVERKHVEMPLGVGVKLEYFFVLAEAPDERRRSYDWTSIDHVFRRLGFKVEEL